jgi:hypothetical protein
LLAHHSYPQYFVPDTQVPNLEPSESASSHDSIEPHTDELSGLLTNRPSTEREGLPRSYQMRADSHYVDHLDSRPAAPAIRIIPTRHIDAAGAGIAVPPAPLVQSIAAHGILQPLLVRRQNGRYNLIAGQKRLAAAIAAGLTDVPCWMYDVDDTEALALAEADNLRADTVAGDATTAGQPASRALEVLRAVSRELTIIDAAAALLGRNGGDVFSQRVAGDLIQAQTWRAAWLSKAALIAGFPDRDSQVKPLGVILDRVKAGFDPQAKLTRLHLDWAIASAAAPIALDEDLTKAAISGCLFATLGWVEGCEEPRAEVRADVPNPRTVRVEIVQRMAPVPDDAARYLREPGVPPAGRDLMTALGLSTAAAVTARYGGAAELTAIGGRGSVIRLTFAKPDAN